MNILITIDFINDNAQHVTNDFANGIILHIDKEEITSDDIIRLKADMRNLIIGLHDPKRYLSSGLFRDCGKEFIDVTLKMCEPNTPLYFCKQFKNFGRVTFKQTNLTKNK